MIAHLYQPTRTSCGPTCVAMLASAPIQNVLAELFKTRRGARQRKRTDSSNVAEIVRLLSAYGFDLDRRERCTTPHLGMFGLLRVHRARPAGGYRAGWHWCVIADGRVFDPERAPVEAKTYFSLRDDAKIFYYAVTRRS